MFVSGLARQTFEAIQSLAADKSPVDPLTVRQKLGRYGEGGEAISAFLCGAIDITPTAAHAGYYGQLLRQRHETRRLRQILHASARRLDDEPADMVQADLMRQLERNDPDPAQDGITFAQATDQAVETFRQIAAGTGGIKTGLAYLDSAGGIQEGELIIIAGKAGSCKTTHARPPDPRPRLRQRGHPVRARHAGDDRIADRCADAHRPLAVDLRLLQDV